MLYLRAMPVHGCAVMSIQTEPLKGLVNIKCVLSFLLLSTKEVFCEKCCNSLVLFRLKVILRIYISAVATVL